jgi:hypothetical protein
MSETGEKEDLSETREERSTVARTLSWTWQILGALLGTATAISIVKNGFGIEIYGLPAKVLAQYVWFRETLLSPVVWVVRKFGIEITWWAKDIVMAYALLGAAHFRAYQVMLETMLRAEPEVSREEHRELLPTRYSLLFWPQLTAQLVRKWARARADRNYFTRHPAIIYGEHPDRARPLWWAESSLAKASDELGHIGLQIVVISLATTMFFLWNYLSGLFGPP